LHDAQWEKWDRPRYWRIKTITIDESVSPERKSKIRGREFQMLPACMPLPAKKAAGTTPTRTPTVIEPVMN